MTSVVHAQNVVLVDSGGANIRSVGNALQRLGVDYLFTRDPQKIASASHVILPGVGHVGTAMRRLRQSGLTALIPRLTQPVLGICVGMQLFFQGSEEADCDLLGLLAGTLRHFPASAVVPHMGWNTCGLSKESSGHPLLEGLSYNDWFYFVHSYYAEPSAYTLFDCHYHLPFSAVVQHNNFYGCQFHPERSGQAGARLLTNFLNISSEQIEGPMGRNG